MKKYIVAVIVAILAVSTLAYANGDSTVFTVEPSVSEGTVTVEVKYENNELIQSGSFNIIYDNDKMSLVEAVSGSAMAESMVVINDKFADNKVRMVWASANSMPKEGVALVLKLELTGGNFSDSDISFEKLMVTNANGVVLTDVVMKMAGDESSGINSGINSEISNGTVSGGSASGGSSKEESQLPKDDEVAPLPEDSDATLPVDKEEETSASVTYVDVNKNNWFYESVKYVSENGLMSGMGDGEFAPNAKLTRAMLVVVLHRLEGTPDGDKSNFTDIEKDSWYEDAVSWAAKEGIVNGMGDGTFAPNANITREQIATILYKFALKKDLAMAGATAILAPDADKISSWAKEGMGWAIGNGLIKGKDDGMLDPTGEATRAEIATILMRFIENTK